MAAAQPTGTVLLTDSQYHRSTLSYYFISSESETGWTTLFKNISELN